jgi:hypothetical protein
MFWQAQRPRLQSSHSPSWFHGLGTNMNQIAHAVNRASIQGHLKLDAETKALLQDVDRKSSEVIRLMATARRILVQSARLQRATNERIFACRPPCRREVGC